MRRQAAVLAAVALIMGILVGGSLSYLDSRGISVPAAVCEGVAIDNPPAWFIAIREGKCFVFP
jgi:hypothetical protein